VQRGGVVAAVDCGLLLDHATHLRLGLRDPVQPGQRDSVILVRVDRVRMISPQQAVTLRGQFTPFRFRLTIAAQGASSSSGQCQEARPVRFFSDGDLQPDIRKPKLASDCGRAATPNSHLLCRGQTPHLPLLVWVGVLKDCFEQPRFVLHSRNRLVTFDVDGPIGHKLDLPPSAW
jgi:hypothetical protein